MSFLDDFVLESFEGCLVSLPLDPSDRACPYMRTVEGFFRDVLVGVKAEEMQRYEDRWKKLMEKSYDGSSCPPTFCTDL
jgi:hypothetical protein